MRKIYTILAALFLTSALFAQVPQKMSYQAIIRDAANNLVASLPIGMRLTILDGMNPVYSETHAATTDVNGLVTVTVGEGGNKVGTLAGVNWGSGVFTIKTETDLTGGTNYAAGVVGTSDIQSVPYALYVKKAGDTNFNGDYNTLTNKPVLDGTETKVTAGSHIAVTGTGAVASPYVISASPVVGGFSHYLGEDIPGVGIVFYIFTGRDGSERVLVAAYNESAQVLQNPVSVTGGDRTWDGVYNTQKYINSPAKTYVQGLGAGWYIPSLDELNYMFQNRYHLNYGLKKRNDSFGGATQLTVEGVYWSSTENKSDPNNIAWSQSFLTSLTTGLDSKASSKRVRAIRHLTPFPSLPEVTTDMPSNITANSATCGGNVTYDGGASITARGVCWNTAGIPTINDSKTVDGSGTGAFTSSITGLIFGTAYYVRAYATNAEGTSYGPEMYIATIPIGYNDPDPTLYGGTIGYIYQPGDPGYVRGQIHGIIVAVDIGAAQFGCNGTFKSAFDQALGTGGINTPKLNCGGGFAAPLCDMYNVNKSDWALPSYEELNKLYLNRTAIGGFITDWYWTSSERVGFATQAWAQHFGVGTQSSLLRTSPRNVRPIRYF